MWGVAGTAIRAYAKNNSGRQRPSKDLVFIHSCVDVLGTRRAECCDDRFRRAGQAAQSRFTRGQSALEILGGPAPSRLASARDAWLIVLDEDVWLQSASWRMPKLTDMPAPAEAPPELEPAQPMQAGGCGHRAVAVAAAAAAAQQQGA